MYLKILIKSICLFLIVISFFSCKKNKEEINIFAAASLKEILEEIKNDYEKEDVKINLNLASSKACVTQILNGAEADVFLSANKKYMDELEKEGFILKKDIFAKNKLIIILNDDIKNINNYEDIINNKLKITIADESVPVGIYTKKFLNNISKDINSYENKFIENVASYELDVKQVLAKVEIGAADCGIVYKTDINENNKSKLKIIEIEDKYNIKAEYYIGIIKKDKYKKHSEKFYNIFFEEYGLKILEKHNFTLP